MTKGQQRRPILTIVAPLAVGVVWLATIVTRSSGDDVFEAVWGLSATVATAFGALILRQRPGHAMGRLLLAVGGLTGLSQGIGLAFAVLDPFGFKYGLLTQAALVISQLLATAALLVASVVVIVRFPSGHRTSQLGALVELCAASLVVGMMVGALLPPLEPAIRTVGVLPAFAAFPLAAIDLAFRYRRAPTIERVQLRWLIAASVVSGALLVSMLLTGDRFAWLWTAWFASTLLPTAAVGIAVLRYRLYDIDRIISRSITYAVVTALLFSLFIIVNVALQFALSPIADADPIVVAVSTLFVAALFQPVRRRIQSLVDRRFDRVRFDAERTSAAFAERLRNEVDLPVLAADLDATVRESIAPTVVGLWLRASSR